MFELSHASFKSFKLCLSVTAYLPAELPSCRLILTVSPQDYNRFCSPLSNDLSILLEGDMMTTSSPSFK